MLVRTTLHYHYQNHDFDPNQSGPTNYLNMESKGLTRTWLLVGPWSIRPEFWDLVDPDPARSRWSLLTGWVRILSNRRFWVEEGWVEVVVVLVRSSPPSFSSHQNFPKSLMVSYNLSKFTWIKLESFKAKCNWMSEQYPH